MNRVSNFNKPLIYLPTKENCNLVTEDNNFLARVIQHNIDSGRASLSSTPENADLIILFQQWSFKLPQHIKELSADDLVTKFTSKLYVVNYDSTVGEGFLSGCYVSLKKSCYDPLRFRPCAYPKTYNEYITPSSHSVDNPELLYSFRGTLHSHPVRQVMYDALKNSECGLIVENTKAFHTHSKEEKEIYLAELINSVFVLCPRGSSPNSYRLFEAMNLGRCPVIISDEWVETPGPDW